MPSTLSKVLVGVASVSSSVSATWTVIATYKDCSPCETVACGTATCEDRLTDDVDVSICKGIAGKGIVAQQYLMPSSDVYLDSALMRLGRKTPDQSVNFLTSQVAQPEARQYAVCDTKLKSCAGFSGADANACKIPQCANPPCGSFTEETNTTNKNMCWGGFLPYEDGTISAMILGSPMTSMAVVEQARMALANSEGLPLGARVMAALNAGADNMEGDVRCRQAKRGGESSSTSAEFLLYGTCAGNRQITIRKRQTDTALAEVTQTFATFSMVDDVCPQATSAPTPVTLVPTPVLTPAPTPQLPQGCAPSCKTPVKAPFTCQGVGLQTVALVPNVYCDEQGRVLIQRYRDGCAGYGEITSVTPGSCGYLFDVDVEFLAKYAQGVVLEDQGRGTATSVCGAVTALEQNTNWHATNAHFETTGSFCFSDPTCAIDEVDFWPNVWQSCGNPACAHWLGSNSHSSTEARPAVSSTTWLVMRPEGDPSICSTLSSLPGFPVEGVYCDADGKSYLETVRPVDQCPASNEGLTILVPGSELSCVMEETQILKGSRDRRRGSRGGRRSVRGARGARNSRSGRLDESDADSEESSASESSLSATASGVIGFFIGLLVGIVAAVSSMCVWTKCQQGKTQKNNVPVVVGTAVSPDSDDNKPRTVQPAASFYDSMSGRGGYPTWWSP